MTIDPLGGSPPFGVPRDINPDTLDIIRGLGYAVYALAGTKRISSLGNDNHGIEGLVVLRRFMPVNNK